MRYVVAAIAALGIVLLLGWGGEDHEVFGQDREGFEERAAQVLVAAPVGLDPAPVITTVVERDRERVPAEVVAQLEELRDLLASAEGQPLDQARPALEEALGKLDATIAQVNTAADEATNAVTERRLKTLRRVLERVRDQIASRLEGA
jgi:hypothetical protein